MILKTEDSEHKEQFSVLSIPVFHEFSNFTELPSQKETNS